MMSSLRPAFFALPLLIGVQSEYLRTQTTEELPYGHPDPKKTYPKYEGFTLHLVEEFDQPIDVLTDPIWTYSDGALGEGRVRYTKEAITFEDGKMLLTAALDPDNSSHQMCSHAESGNVTLMELTSGELRTRHNMFRYGRYETRMKPPVIQNDTSIDGNYIATMFTYRDGKFRHWREIDIEVVGSKGVVTNVLWAENTTHWSPEIARPNEKTMNQTVRKDFHDYAFEWLPNKITWFLDGKEFRSFEGDADVLVPEMSGKIMMSLWIFGDGYHFGGKDGDNNRYPLETEYDWFRFYKWNGDDEYPCAGLETTCLTADDKYLSSNNPCDGIVQEGDEWRTPCLTATCPYTPVPAPAPAPAPAPKPEASPLPWILLVCGVLVCAAIGLCVATKLGPAETASPPQLGAQLSSDVNAS